MNKEVERKFAIMMCWCLPFSLFVSLVPLIVATDGLGMYLAGINFGLFFLNGIIHIPKVMGWVD